MTNQGRPGPASASWPAPEAALDGLDERSRALLEARWPSHRKATLQNSPSNMGFPPNASASIEKAAMNKIRVRLAT